ncbi:unnamed protein product [Urochloa decumbens]|uniref:No apical meristem-associated C-terminal domain-containing protein n=1 Tax=Urochloa decumbens TaxID=240449 RepID=A0ABC9GD92_9POAL
MPRQSKRTSTPAPVEILPPPAARPVPQSVAPSTFGLGAWCPPYPPQSMAPSSSPYWIHGLQHPGMAGSSPQGSWCAPASSASMEDSDLQVMGVDCTPPGGLLNFLNKNTPKHGPAQVVINERPIGGKKAKELKKRKRKDEACIIDLEDELQLFVDAQNKANEGRKEILETQKRVSRRSYLATQTKELARMW